MITLAQLKQIKSRKKVINLNKFGVPTEAQLAKINKLAKRTLSLDEVFVFSGKSAGDLMIPGRYMRLSKELLQVMATDAQKGVSFMLNHNWSSFGVQAVPYGKVFDGVIESSTEEGETVSLSLSKYIVRDSEVVDGVSADNLIKKIETGVLSDTSIGWGTDTMVCSICGMNYYGGECSHWKGRTYEMADGSQKLCTVTAMPPSIIIPYNNNALYEESIVWDGAYPGAIVTQSKHGDVIEMPNGKFTVIQDKEELPENTLFYGKYHNGDIIIMVKKSDNKKIFAVTDVLNDASNHSASAGQLVGKTIKTILKGGENLMNEKAIKMLEAFGITFKEGESTTEELFDQLAEKWATIPVVEPKEGETQSYMTQVQVSEKLGKEMPADEVLKLAKEGQDYHKQVIDDAVAMGVRAQGNDFPAETWKTTFSAMGTSAIKDIMKTFEAQAKAELPAGRLTNPGASFNKDVSIPDEAFTVGK
jgi:hypothetical protein